VGAARAFLMRIGTQRTGHTIVKMSLLVSLFSGCAKKPADTVPGGLGVSVALRYPVLLAGGQQLVLKDDEESLTTTA